MIKILHIAPIGKQAEGIGTVLKRLTHEQIKLGCDVRIVSKYQNDVYDDFEFITIKTPKAFLQYIVSYEPNIVVFHSMYEMEYIGFSKILKKRNIPYLVQMHGALSVENYKKGYIKKWIANKIWFNKFLKDSRCIIYLNKAEYDNCVVNCINSNYAILPNGCDLKLCDCGIREINNIIDIIYIGRINIIHKGLDVLVKAIQLLKNDGFLNVHFSFYGNVNDPDVDEFKELIKPLNGYADFYGGIYGEAKEQRLKKCDIFILTSRYEGMPMGVLEALSYGLPCIVTPGTNMADIISEADAGWIADFSAESILNTIFKAIADLKDRKTVIKRNAYELSKKYSWKEIAKKSIKILSRCIE